MSSEGSRRPPEALPDDLHDMLATFREVESLPAASRERIWKTVGAEEPPRRRFVAPPSAPARSGRRWVVGALAAVAAVALLWTMAADGVLAGRTDASQADQAAAFAEDTQRSGGAAVERDTASGQASRHPRARGTTSVALDDAPEPSLSEADAALPSEPAPLDQVGAATAGRDPTSGVPGSAAGPANPPRPRPRRRKVEPSPTVEPTVEEPTVEEPTVAPSVVAPASTLAEEQRLVGQAWAALARGDNERARVLATSHATRFPDAMLGPERDAVLTIARCRTQPERAASIVRSFGEAHGSSPLRSRVSRACTAAGKKSTAP